MKRLVIAVIIFSTIGLVSCSSPNYTSGTTYTERKYRTFEDPYFNNYGFYAPPPVGYYNRGYYGNRFNRPYNGYNRPYITRRPPVIIQRTPAPYLRVKPVNPRTDKWNPNDHKRTN